MGQYKCCVFCMIFVVVCCSYFKGGGALNFYGWPYYTYLDCSYISLRTYITLFPGILISENIQKIVAHLSTL